jgi:hypothetical protein
MEEFDEDTEAFSVNDQTTVIAMESAQRAAPLQASSSLPTLRRELMDIRDLLSN